MGTSPGLSSNVITYASGISIQEISGVNEGHIVLALKKIPSPLKNAMFQRYLEVHFEELE